MPRPSARAVLVAIVVVLASASGARAQTPGTDNRDGYFVNFEEAPVRAMALSPNGLRIWVVNPADASVTVLNKTTLASISVVPVGLGPVWVGRRPGTNEMWVVCHSSNSIVIVDAPSFLILDSIEVGHEPNGLVFTDDGSTAYVTNSQDNTIDVIDAATRTVTQTIEFGSNDFLLPSDPTDPVLNAEEPRAIVLDGSTLYALSFESGNGTMTSGGNIFDGWPSFIGGSFPLPPPDRDVFSFDASSPGSPGHVALWRIGSLNLDLKVRPEFAETRLYVSNVDHKNTLDGEFQFPIQGIAAHRVSHAAPIAPGANPPQTTTHIDLNVDQHMGLGGLSRFATPNEMTFDSTGQTLYVACYETRNAAVIDANTDQVVAELECGAGPRGVLLDEAAGRLYVYNRADQSINVFVVPVPVGTVVSPLMTGSAGFDPTPEPVKRGRRHAIDASNSSTGTQSCNTCHMDGAKDGIAWQLGSFTGDLPANPVEKDDKRIKVTQSLRGIEETPPFHWRGDRSDLKAFNPAFSGLLGGSPLSDADFADFQAYVFSLSYGPNPRQQIDRSYSAQAQSGLGFFTSSVADTVVTDTIGGTVSFSCNDCHSMSGFSATVNQIVNDSGTGLFADDASQLRGMFDKESDVVDYRGVVPLPPPVLQQLPATGWGFLNPGTIDGIRQFVVQLFQMPLSEELDIAQFCIELDSGTAPAAGTSWTLTQAKAGSPTTSPVTTVFIPQANAGNIDLVARGWINVGTGVVRIGMLFRPSTQQFETARTATGFGPFTYDELDDLAEAGNASLLFFGDSVKSGVRRGIDRDMDGAKDNDEVALGTSTSDPDSDDDGFPDGHEIAHGSNPLDDQSTPIDVTRPVIQGAAVSWKNSNVAKLRWTTSEPATSRVMVDSVGGPIPYSAAFVESQFKTEHVMVVRGLNPGQTYDFTIDAVDPGLNPATPVILNDSMQPHLFDSVHSSDVKLSVKSVNLATGKASLRATFTIVDQNGVLEAGSAVSGRFVEWIPGGSTTVTNFGPTNPTGATGKTTANYTTVNPVNSGATVEVIVDSIADDTKLHFHPLETVFCAQLIL